MSAIMRRRKRTFRKYGLVFSKAGMNTIISGRPKETSRWTASRLADPGDELRQAEVSWAANADSFHRAPAPGGTDYILANPPFNMSDWAGDRLRDDPRWKPSVSETPRRRRARRVSAAKQYGVRIANCRPLPLGLCEFAWVQHFIHHLAPMP